MANKDTNNPVDVNNQSATRRSADLLPLVHRTDRNTKFLASTIDQYIQTPQIKRIDGYVGSKLTPTYNPLTDQYLNTTDTFRGAYQLEPSMVVSDEHQNINAAYGYDDLINKLAFNNANVSNLDRLFRPQSYSFNPHIDWDKFVNFREYYWMPTGPDTITISGQQKNTVSTYTVTDSLDGTALIFTPDGLEYNPILTLYRGMTYVFEVNSANPFYIKTAYVQMIDSLYNNVTNNGVSNGQVIVTVDDTTPSELYYFSQGNDTAVGRFAIKNLVDNSIIDVDAEVVGKKNYSSGNGVTLSNGMKIKFTGSVTPSTYVGKTYYVEGVGDAIKLIDIDTLRPVGKPTTNLDPNFDATLFDQYPFDDFGYVPLTPEYVTINKAASNKNQWSVYNRWVHSSVIETTAAINGVSPDFQPNMRAKRPIIEFSADLQLYNYGVTAKATVDLIDHRTTDAFKVVENSTGYAVDGIPLEAGHRVIFNVDSDPLVRGKIYQVKVVSINGSMRINLEETTDSTPLLNDSVMVANGLDNIGTAWWFNGSSWSKAQQKTSLNQAPLFELFDNNGIKYSDTSVYDTTFSGTKIFGYQLGTVYDAVLGLNLAYRSVANVSEYLFENFYDTEKFTIMNSGVITETNVSDGYICRNINGENHFSTIWTKTINKPIPIIQYQVLPSDSQYVEIIAIDRAGYDSSLKVDVFVNDNKLRRNVDYTVSTQMDRAYVVSSTSFSANDRVLIKIISNKTPNANGYYETPINLTNNPLNGSVSSFTLSELNDHMKSMADSDPDFDGKVYGKNNMRDLVNYPQYGTRIVTHQSPISFAHYFLGGELDDDLIAATRKVATDYNQFKANLIRHITNLNGNYTPDRALDVVMNAMVAERIGIESYSNSDMIGFGSDNVARVFVVTDPRNTQYALTTTFNDTILSNRSVLVYKNDSLLVNGRDYEFSKYDPTVTILTSLVVGDILTIRDYPNTTGSIIPPTPTKLGLFPKYVPSIYVDDTYVTPRTVIQGHDGSIMVAYNDYRDAIILEYEMRVYNNLKVKYDPTLVPLVDIFGGAFRESQYTSTEINDILSSDLLRWSGFFGVDFQANTTFDETNSFTFNHTGTIDSIFKQPLNGYWRSVYKHFYDTDRPHTHPWEMLGFTEQPSWWEEKYGPAPYTRGNTILWEDLELGKNAYTGAIDPVYARPNLSKIIPVDDNGKLLSPTDSGLSTTPIINPLDTNRIILLRSEQISASWQVGDQGPAETSWRRSSWWPYVCQILLAVTKPAAYAALMFDTSRVHQNVVGEYRYGSSQSFLTPTNVALYNENVKGVSTLASGYSVMLIEAGMMRDTNYINTLRSDLDNLSYRLMSKLGGYTSSAKLQVSIDAVNIDSSAKGVILSPEDYNIFFNTGNPVESIGISGFIVQKTNRGWTVRGYDKYKPYFNVHRPYQSNTDQVDRIGGVSEPYVKWAQNTVYNAGQVVFYSDRYYRVKQKHNSDNTFNVMYYQSLPYLPIVGGISIKRRTSFDPNVTVIPYGVEYTTAQEVYDLIVGYGDYIVSKGFVFDEYNQDLSQILDWRFTANEFLYWTTQQWAVNSVITLSPFANQLSFHSTDSVVDNVITPFYEYSLLRADGSPFPQHNFSVTRLDGDFKITTMNTQDGLFFAQLNLIQKEHAIVLNNTSMFSDVIYSTETGYRQQRIKLKGFITDNWNGDFFSPGFVFDQANVSDWTKYTTYKIGDVVRFNGNYYSATKSIVGSETFDITQWSVLRDKPMARLLPNFEYKINQFEDFYSLDIDNFDASQQAMAQHLVGYTSRPYMDFIVGDPIAQYKFYQGFIREKGTKNPLTKLAKASLSNHGSQVNFNEEWAFRIGAYGGYNTYQELEFGLTSTSFQENPQIINFVEGVPVNDVSRISYKTASDIVLSPDNFNVSQVFNTTDSSVFKLPHAGFVRTDDVTATAFNKNSVLDIANNSKLQEGDTVWIAYTENSDWSVLRVTNVPTYISEVDIYVPSESLIFSTYYDHQLKVGDLISVKSVSSEVNKCYIVKELISPKQFTVFSTLPSLLPINDPLLGSLSVFKSSRVGSFDELTSIPFLDKWQFGEKVWADDNGSNVSVVYKKSDNYVGSVITSPTNNIFGQHFGQSIHTTDDTNIIAVSAPDYSYLDTVTGDTIYGRVFVLRKNTFGVIELMESLTINDKYGSNYVENNTANRFGAVVKYDSIHNLLVASAPNASHVKDVHTGTFVVNNNNTVTNSVINQGVVKLSLLDSTQYTLLDESVVITTDTATTGSNYGWAVALSTPYLTTSTLKVTDISNIVIGNAVSGGYISGTPVVTAINGNYITVNIPQSLNTATVLDYSMSTLATTDVENTTTVRVASTSGILINSLLTGVYSSPAYVTGIGNNTVNLSVPQTFNTNTVVTFVNTTSLSVSYGTGQKLLVSAPHIDASGIGQVYSYDLNVGTHIAVNYSAISQLSHANTSTTELYGYSVSGDRTLNRIAVSAPGNINASPAIGAIYVYDMMVSSNPIQIITSNDLANPMTDADIFATKVEMSFDGQYLVVASPYALDPTLGLRTGVVDIFKWNGIKFIHSQRISVPISVISNNTIFGFDISLSRSNEVLTITTVGDAAIANPTFDKYSESSDTIYVNDPTSAERKAKTVFDGGSTLFSYKNRNAGTVHIYNKIGNNSTKWVYGQQALSSGITDDSMFGSSILALDNSVFVGAPAKLLTGSNGANNGIGQIFEFDKIDSSVNTWFEYRVEEPLVDITSFNRIATIDTIAEQIVDYFDIVDPLKGKFLGTAQSELRYVSPYDPSIYSIGITGVNVDTTNNWLDEHVGELWWDLSTVKFMWYEQGELEYRKSNWNNIFPGCSVDVYEWVRSEYLPSEWSQLADTPKGLAIGVSGQPKFLDNSVISVKQVYSSTSNTFSNVYYYWVKNKVTLPSQNTVRKIPAYQVAQSIANPQQTGDKYVSVISPTAITMTNTAPSVTNEHINLNISFDTETDSANKHTEWSIVTENDHVFNVPSALVQKLIDSLLGYDQLGNAIPDPLLVGKQRYGVSVRPRQTMFMNRNEAVHNLVEAANSIMASERITAQVDFTNLNMADTLPDASNYDVLVEDQYNLELIDTTILKTAKLTANIDANGSIQSINIVDAGYGYATVPTVTINDSGYGAVLSLTIDQLGRVTNVDVVDGGANYTANIELVVRPYTVAIRVDSNTNNKWAIYEWVENESAWVKIRTQSFNTPLYWDYIDWQDTSYSPYTGLTSTIDSVYELYTIVESTTIGAYVKVRNGSNGNYIILERTDGNGGTYDPSWNIVYAEKGTIRISDTVWSVQSPYAWDQVAGYDGTLYDQTPTKELEYIIKALFDDIFIGDRSVYKNQVFFKLVRYALSEQKFIDWAFKTTFINVVNSAGELNQPATYISSSSVYYESFLNEVKPYHTKIRSYTDLYTGTDYTNTFNTDFDLPSYYDSTNGAFSKVEFGNTLLLQYPWRSWFDNYAFHVESITVIDGGVGYTVAPQVEIIPAIGDTGYGATAVAYLRNGSISQVLMTSAGQGYTATPTIVFNGGGNTVTRPAHAYAQLGNNLVRSNKVSMKFDRVSANREVGSKIHTETFLPSDGATIDYPLTWAPINDKELITLTRNGLIQTIDTFTINFETKPYTSGNGTSYNKLYATLSLNYIPNKGDVFSITYPKSLEYYTAADRIYDYYAPTSGMPGITTVIDPNNGDVTQSLDQLMSGVEYSGLIVTDLPFSSTGGWDAMGISWEKNPWDNLGQEDGYVSYVTTLTNTQTFTIPTIVPTNVQVNTYAYPNGSVNGIRLDGTNTVVDTLIGMGTGAVDRVEMIVPGAGYNSSNTTVLITAPETLNGRTAQLSVNITAGEISINVVDGGSGYLQTPTITILEGGNASTSTVTVQAYARAVLKAEFMPLHSTQTVSSITVPSSVFTTSPTLIAFRYSSSDGTSFYESDNNLDAIVSGGSLVTDLNGFTTAKGVLPSEVILDGGSTSTRHITGMNDDGFLNPINSYAPEECVPGQIHESIGITLYSEPTTKPPTIVNVYYEVTATTQTFELGLRPVNSESVIPVFNNSRLSTSTYTVDYDAKTITVNNIGTGTLSVTTMELGTINMVDSFYANSNSTSTTFTSSNVRYKVVGSVYVTVDGQRVDPPDYTLTSYRGAARVIVNKAGSIQVYLFDSVVKSYSEVVRQYPVAVEGQTQYGLNPLPANAEPYHTQVIMTKNNLRLAPPMTTYWEVINNQYVYPVTQNPSTMPIKYAKKDLEVYKNGSAMSTRSWTLNQMAGTIQFTTNSITNGDVLAIVVKGLQDYLIQDGNLILTTPTVSTDVLCVTTFTNHDPDFIRTDTFKLSPLNRYTIQRPAIDIAYVWVSYNGVSLMPSIDYSLDIDNQTVILRSGLYNSMDDVIVVTSFAIQSSLNIGTKIFRDMLGRTRYTTVNPLNTTELASPLALTDTTIQVTNSAVLTPPNVFLNRPGVIFIEGERIEFFVINGNTLSQLRRSTLGTGPRTMYSAGTKVVDQGDKQTVVSTDKVMKFETKTSTSTNQYIIPPESITFDSGVKLDEQVEVWYQGRLLLKPSVVTTKHNFDISYDSDNVADTVISPSYTIGYQGTDVVITFNTDIIAPINGSLLGVYKKVTE